jgi:hypothetical protein
MSTCTTNIEPIYDTEYIGESLTKINDNFERLKNAAKTFEDRVNSNVGVRTFFYYGVNSATDPYSGVQSGVPSVPSVPTIENFVNNANLLNLPAITQIGDIAFVVYQKTGWFQPQTITYTRTESGTVPFTVQEKYKQAYTVKIGIGGRKGGGTVTKYRDAVRDITRTVAWSATLHPTDDNMLFAPIFVLYKLVYSGTRYSAVAGFPKFIQATGADTINWNKPNVWSTY